MIRLQRTWFAVVVMAIALMPTLVHADTLFDDPMATVKRLSPRNATCTDAASAPGVACTVSTRDGSFVAEYLPGPKPSIVVTATSPTNSWAGFDYTLHFKYAVEGLGFTNECAQQSLNNNFRPVSFERNGYTYECSARIDMASRTVVSRFVVRSPVAATAPTPPAPATTGTWPGLWQVSALADGRLYARVEMHDDGDMEYGGVSTFGVICVRGGGLKIGFESLDGTRHRSIVVFPQHYGGVDYPLAENEIRGEQARIALADLVDIERMSRENGNKEFWVTYSAYGEAEYTSEFNLAGLTEVVQRLNRDCPA